MTRIRQAWQRIKAVQQEHQPAFQPDVMHTYEGGKAWLEPLLLRHGLSQADIDELAAIDMENFEVTLANVKRLMASEKVFTGEDFVSDAMTQEMAFRIMHASGMSNGLALGLEFARNA